MRPVTVKLPSDYLTKKQKERKNGKMATYDLSKPMKWKEFKYMPDDLQVEYIRKLEAMGANNRMISGMLGCAVEYFSRYRKQLGMEPRGSKGVTHKKSTPEFDAFLNQEEEAAAPEPAAEPQPEAGSANPNPNPVPQVSVPHGVIPYAGEFQFEGTAFQIGTYIAGHLGNAGKLHVRFMWNVIPDEPPEWQKMPHPDGTL